MMREFRCSHCGSLLFKAEFIGRVEIKCQRGKCGAFNTFIVEPPRVEPVVTPLSQFEVVQKPA